MISIALRLALFLIVSGVLSGAEYYVAGSGDDKQAGDSPSTAFRTIQKAANLAGPGDIVNIMNGEYTNPTATASVVDLSRSGTADAWITLRAYQDHKPLLKFNGWNGISVSKGASYLDISGLELQGFRADYTFEYCRAERGNDTAACNTNGISIDSRNSEQKSHHIRIARNHIWQCNGGGISAIQADYILIEDNLVHETSWYARYATSGISFLLGWNADDAPGTHTIIRRNRVFNNRSFVEWKAIDRLSDGNGIIIDSLRNVNTNPRTAAYRGGVRVENNLSFNNGGSGIEVFQSDNVDVVNNTVYKNGQVVGYADILVNYAASVNVLNNVAYSRFRAKPIDVINSTNVTVDFNLSFNGTSTAAGPNDLTTDPKFGNASTEYAFADFRLAEGSPAVASGNGRVAPSDDLDGKPRPGDGRVSRGAIEAIMKPVE